MEWRMFPLDVLFFRGTEPMNAGESVVVQGMFPPTPEVLQGFVRAALLEHMGVPFQEYLKAARGDSNASSLAKEAVELIGDHRESLGAIDIRGPYLVSVRGGQVYHRWYPAPLDLREEGGSWHAASPRDALIECDLGSVRLLEAAGESPSDRWISDAGLSRYLAGQSVPGDDVAKASCFYKREPRVGIARDAASRAVREGMLYSPDFVRLHESESGPVGRVGIGVRLDGVDEELQRACSGIRRLGGEGRMVEVEIHEDFPLPKAGVSSSKGRLLLLAPARWNGSWLPPGDQPPSMAASGGRWPAVLNGISLGIISAAVGRWVRIGGWNIVDNRPKPAVACVPAGSVYFVEAEEPGSLISLHDAKAGSRTAAGFGHLYLGRWNDGGS